MEAIANQRQHADADGFAALLRRHRGIVYKVAGTYARGADDREHDQHLRLLQGFMATLDPLNRALLLLYLEDRSAREIGDVLGISPSNVGTRIGRLKQRIRDHVAPPPHA